MTSRGTADSTNVNGDRKFVPSEQATGKDDPFDHYRLAALTSTKSDSNRTPLTDASVPNATVDGQFIEFSGSKQFEIAENKKITASKLGFNFPTNPDTLVRDPARRHDLENYSKQLIGTVTGEETLEVKYDSTGLPYDVQSRDMNLTYREYGQLLNKISENKNLTEAEKVFVWSKLNNGADKLYKTSTEGANPQVIDSIMPWDTGHAILQGGIGDGYHVPLANLSEAEARNVITEHERNEGKKFGPIGQTARWVLGVVTGTGEINRGDFYASINQVAALRALKQEGFAGYAREWNERFVQH